MNRSRGSRKLHKSIISCFNIRILSFQISKDMPFIPLVSVVSTGDSTSTLFLRIWRMALKRWQCNNLLTTYVSVKPTKPLTADQIFCHVGTWWHVLWSVSTTCWIAFHCSIILPKTFSLEPYPVTQSDTTEWFESFNCTCVSLSSCFFFQL